MWNPMNNTVQRIRNKQTFVGVRSKCVWTFRLQNLCQPFHAWITVYLQNTIRRRTSMQLLFVLVKVYPLSSVYLSTLVVIIRSRHRKPTSAGGYIQDVYKVLFLRPPMGKIGGIKKAHEKKQVIQALLKRKMKFRMRG